MGKGLSKQQTVILGLLRGTEKGLRYTSGGELTTAELADELCEREMFSENAPRRQRLFTVRRACDSLLSRGMIEGSYTIAQPYTWARVISWKATAVGKQPKRSKRGRAP
jgi:hypothetical protein